MTPRLGGLSGLMIEIMIERMKEKLNVSVATINREIAALKEAQVLIREGGDFGGRWVVFL